MIVFAIRLTGTNKYLPQVRNGGYSFTEFEEEGGQYGPRLHTSRRRAQQALAAWRRGYHKPKWIRSHSFDGEDDEYELVVQEVPERFNMRCEIVEFTLSERRVWEA